MCISIKRGPFKKGYLGSWSEELFVVKHAVVNNPTVYKLRGQTGEDIKERSIQRKFRRLLEVSFTLQNRKDILIIQ